MATTKSSTSRPKRVRSAEASRGLDAARSRGISSSTNAGAAMISVDKPLTEMQKLFVKFWAEGDSITAAAHRAGYSDGAAYAYRMVHQPNILALKARYEAKYEEAAQMSRKKVMDMHMEAFEMAKLMAEPASMVSAAREIGKMCGYYAPVEVKVKVDVQGNLIVGHLNALSDSELLEAISKGSMNDLPGLGHEEHVD